MGIYGACLGQTGYFGKDAYWLAGISGIFIGIGQIVAALFRIVFSRLDFYRHRSQNYFFKLVYIFIAVSVSFLCSLLTFLFLPDKSPIGKTDEQSIFLPNKIIAILCSFMLGFADCLFQTEILNVIGAKFNKSTPSAMAMYSFFQAIGGVFVFFYTNHLSFGLRIQVSIDKQFKIWFTF